MGRTMTLAQPHLRSVALALVAFGLATWCLACGTTTTVYQRVASVGNPYLPSRSGGPMKEDQIRLAAEVNSYLIAGPETSGNSSAASPSLWVARAQFGGSAYFGVSESVELGAHGRMAPVSMARRNMVATPTLPEGANASSIQLGAGLRFNKRLGEDKLGFISLLTELNFVQIPHATWTSSTYVDNWNHRATSGSGFEVATPMVGQIALSFQGGYQVLPFLTLFGTATVETLHRNQHSVMTINAGADFSADPDPLQAYFAMLAGGGLEVALEHFFVNAMVFYPFHGEANLHFGPALSATVGVIL
jgi:hypothetical protein